MSNKKKIIVIVFLLIIAILIIIATVNYDRELDTERKQDQRQSQSQTKSDDYSLVVVRGGSGETAKQGNRVTILYSGYILDNNGDKEPIDKDQLYTFTLGKGGVIRAWEEGVLGMRVGEVVEITAPPSYAYGDNDEISFLPPNSTLFFEITMMSIESSN